MIRASRRRWTEEFPSGGDYKKTILDWIHEHYPKLDELYHEIYTKRSREYWNDLDTRMRAYTGKEGMPYYRAVDDKRAAFGELPVVVNYFYHEEVKKSAQKKAKYSLSSCTDRELQQTWQHLKDSGRFQPDRALPAAASTAITRSRIPMCSPRQRLWEEICKRRKKLHRLTYGAVML